MRPFIGAVAGLLLLPAALTACKESARPPQAASSNEATSTMAAPPSARTDSTSSAGAASPVMPAVQPAQPSRTGTLQNPDDQAVLFLYEALSNQAPDLAQWAHDAATSQTQNEFEQKAIESRLLDQYRQKLTDAANVGHMTLELRTELSAYDDQAGAFYVTIFNPIDILSYSYKGKRVRIAFANGDAAQHWKLAPADAAAVLRANNAFHGIEVEALVDVLGAEADDDGGGVVNVKIDSYRVFSPGHQKKLGEVVVGR